MSELEAGSQIEAGSCSALSSAHSIASMYVYLTAMQVPSKRSCNVLFKPLVVKYVHWKGDASMREFRDGVCHVANDVVIAILPHMALVACKGEK